MKKYIKTQDSICPICKKEADKFGHHCGHLVKITVKGVRVWLNIKSED